MSDFSAAYSSSRGASRYLVLLCIQVIGCLALGCASTVADGSLEANQEIELPAIWSDNAVILSNKQIPIWERTAPSTKITVTFLGHDRSTISGPTGQFEVLLPPMPATDENVILSFAYDIGLSTRDGEPLAGFEAAGRGGAFDGIAVNLIDRDLLGSACRIRYEWQKNSNPQITNKSGLPGSPFQTNWCSTQE